MPIGHKGGVVEVYKCISQKDELEPDGTLA